MPSIQQNLQTRSRYHSRRPISRGTSIIIGCCCSALAIIMLITIWVHTQKRSTRNPAETTYTAQREQRRVNQGWWGRQSKPETATERRARLAREARERRESRATEEQANQLPVYQPPAATYQQQQSLVEQRQVPLPSSTTANFQDLPPAYDSTAAWPTRG